MRPAGSPPPRWAIAASYVVWLSALSLLSAVLCFALMARQWSSTYGYVGVLMGQGTSPAELSRIVLTSAGVGVLTGLGTAAALAVSHLKNKKAEQEHAQRKQQEKAQRGKPF